MNHGANSGNPSAALPNGTSDEGLDRPSPELLQLRVLQSAVQLDSTRVLRALSARVSELLATGDPSDVTAPQANALAVLFAVKEPMTARQLAEAMSVSQVTVCRFINTLETKGWVGRARDPADKRSLLISLTDKAYLKLPRMIHIANTVFDEAFDGFSPQEVRQLSGLIGRIRDNLGV